MGKCALALAESNVPGKSFRTGLCDAETHALSEVPVEHGVDAQLRLALKLACVGVEHQLVVTSALGSAQALLCCLVEVMTGTAQNLACAVVRVKVALATVDVFAAAFAG